MNYSFAVLHVKRNEYMLYVRDDNARGLSELMYMGAVLKNTLTKEIRPHATITSVDEAHVFSPEAGFVQVGITFRIKESRASFESNTNLEIVDEVS